MRGYNTFKPTLQKAFNKKIYGFDIETCNNNKMFVCASVYFDDSLKWFFKDKDDLISFFKTKRFMNSFVVATNLGFDFNGVFYKTSEIMDFKPLYRGSDLIITTSHIYNKRFNIKNGGQRRNTINFIDTLNYAKLGVEKLAKILGMEKFSVCNIGKMPRNKDEWETMKDYNMQDAKISKKAFVFLKDSFIELGANVKPTIASTAMSLFKNKYLDKCYYRHEIPELIDEFKAYYGGRTEAFMRGRFENYYYYDFNSLYPSVMLNHYPDPNSLRRTNKNTLYYIEEYEGVSEVEVSCPFMDYPLLPFRTKTKLLFPIGTFKAWYSHVELRRALTLGYTIKKVFKTIYFKDICHPFVDFVNDLYSKRIVFKEKKNPMELVVKILLNSLYGKFGQKFMDRDDWLPMTLNYDEIQKLDDFEIIDGFIRIKKKMTYPSSFIMPIWALYTTAYARLKLHEHILRSHPAYVDTDSLITTQSFEDSNKLGKLKLEMKIKEGIVVKPKFYMLKPYHQKDYVKVKGVGIKLSCHDFYDLLKHKNIVYSKFMKFKESIRRGFIPNEIQEITKVLSLEDNKRNWQGSFNIDKLQSSTPIDITKHEKEIPFIYEEKISL